MRQDIYAEQEIGRITDVDIPAWLDHKVCFRSTLFSLIGVADSRNRKRIRRVFPLEFEAFSRWEAGHARLAV